MADRQLFIYMIQAVRHAMITRSRTTEEDRAVDEHYKYLEHLRDEGVVHLAGRTLSEDYAGFGIVIFSADSQAAAEKVVEADPAVKSRVMRAELYPFRASLVGELPKS